MSYVIELTFSECPPALNKLLRMHKHEKNRLMEFWRNMVFTHAIGQRPNKPLKSAKITIVRRSYRMLDYDGCVGSMKPVIDGVVKAGILKDDTYKITGPWDVTQEFRPKKDGQELYLAIKSLASASK